MNISMYKVVYEQRVYNCIAMMPEYECRPQAQDQEQDKRQPDILHVSVIDEDGRFLELCNNSEMFQFIPKK